MSSSRCRSAASRSSMRWTRRAARCRSTGFSTLRCVIPGNYGFIPHTLSDDGDPCDVIVANTRAIVPGAVMSCRVVGVLIMEDEAGGDEKLLAVPSAKLTQRYANVNNYSDLPSITHPADRAFLRPLQGSRAQQVGQDRPLGRCGRSARARARRHRAGQEGEGRGQGEELGWTLNEMRALRAGEDGRAETRRVRDLGR